MLHIIHRRFENIHILLHPVRVQGEGASLEIAKAIADFNRWMNVDVIIVGRGGGSLEDLWSFNEEVVARAIYHSQIPIISAVGHETDYTISDFVADLRAPTPSAAAELVVRDKREVKKSIYNLEERLENQIFQILQENRTDLLHSRRMLVDPRNKIERYFLRVDDLGNRFYVLTSWILKGKKERSTQLSERLYLQNPIQRVESLRLMISETTKRQVQMIRHSVEIRKQKAAGILGRLGSLSPLSVLERGYSITRKLPSLKILRDSALVKVGDKVEVKLHRGTLLCDVEKAEIS
jgi:exodeoxyribonuclease VII large subunit